MNMDEDEMVAAYRADNYNELARDFVNERKLQAKRAQYDDFEDFVEEEGLVDDFEEYVRESAMLVQEVLETDLSMRNLR